MATPAPSPTTPPIPLTTTFTPPPDCTTDTYQIEWSANSNYYTLPPTATGVWGWMSLGATDWATCFPSGYTTNSYFSPGLCPTGYSAGGLSYVSLDGKTETRGTCCPTGYNPQTGNDWPWYAYNPCTSSNANTIYTFTARGTVTSQSGAVGINAKGISIRWQSDDFTTPTTTSPTSSASNTETSPGASTATPTDPAKISPSNNTLSSGAKAGIGIGVAVGVIIVLVIAFLAYRLRRTRKSVKDVSAPAVAPGSVTGTATATVPVSEPISVSERSYVTRGNGVPVELDSQQGSSQGRMVSEGLSELDTSRQ